MILSGIKSKTHTYHQQTTNMKQQKKKIHFNDNTKKFKRYYFLG